MTALLRESAAPLRPIAAATGRRITGRARASRHAAEGDGGAGPAIASAGGVGSRGHLPDALGREGAGSGEGGAPEPEALRQQSRAAEPRASRLLRTRGVRLGARRIGGASRIVLPSAGGPGAGRGPRVSVGGGRRLRPRAAGGRAVLPAAPRRPARRARRAGPGSGGALLRDLDAPAARRPAAARVVR